MTNADRGDDRAARPTEPLSAAIDLEAARLNTVVDRYAITRVLGRGGMGAVYEARHTTLGRRCAVKFLLPRVAGNPDVLRRFENEAKAAGGLEHPNLVAVTDFGRDAAGAPYLVMEFLQGEDCARLLERAGRLPPPRAADIVLQCCRGLAVAHQMGIIHRDLKPANLFLTDAGDGSDLVKVLDFGIAKLRLPEAGVATGTGETFGTAHYMSPEQARASGDVDGRTDVWSLGVVLYELLAGRRPFQDGPFLHVVYQILSTAPPPLAAARPDLPAGLIAVVERAMAREAAQRYPSVVALGEALAAFAARGRGVAASVRSEGLADTSLTPATGIQVGTDPAGDGLPAVPRLDVRQLSSPGGHPVPGPTRPGVRKGWGAVALAVALGAAALVGWRLKIAPPEVPRSATAPHAPAPTPTLVDPAPAPAPPAPPPSPAIDRARGASLPASVTALVAPAPPGDSLTPPSLQALRPSVDALTRQPKQSRPASPGVRTTFEHENRRSNTAHLSVDHAPAAGSSAGPPPNPAPIAGVPSSEHPLDIDENSPYAR